MLDCLSRPIFPAAALWLFVDRIPVDARCPLLSTLTFFPSLWGEFFRTLGTSPPTGWVPIVSPLPDLSLRSRVFSLACVRLSISLPVFFLDNFSLPVLL